MFGADCSIAKQTNKNNNPVLAANQQASQIKGFVGEIYIALSSLGPALITSSVQFLLPMPRATEYNLAVTCRWALPPQFHSGMLFPLTL